MTQRKRSYDRGRAVRRLARQRVGSVPASRPIEPKTRRKRPKHKKPAWEENDGSL